MLTKKTPPSQFIIDRLDNISPGTKEEMQQQIRQALATVKYLGDVKQLAERYGLHYLRSKRMRGRELRQWIVDNHPALEKAEKPVVVGVDWAEEPDRSIVSVVEVQEDGSFKIVETREDERGRAEEGGPSRTDR